MKTRLIQIGNSRGVRLPATVIEACGFGDELELRVEDGAVVLRSLHKPRHGWGESFQAMAQAGDDALLLGDETGNVFDRTEWTW